MKIDSSVLSAYTLGTQRQTAAAGIGSGSDGTSSASRNIPTVGPSAAIPSGLANALWLANAKVEKAQDESDSLIAEFMELSKMTPAERLRKEMLEELGLTEDTLASLPDDQRESIEEDIRRALKEQLGIEDKTQAGVTEGQSVSGPEEAKA